MCDPIITDKTFKIAKRGRPKKGAAAETERPKAQEAKKRGRPVVEVHPPPSPVVEEEPSDGLRRSKRHRVDKNCIPQYTFEVIRDYAGREVRVKTLVATREKPRLFDLPKKSKVQQHRKPDRQRAEENLKKVCRPEPCNRSVRLK